jgi:CRP-like cAMP-binding protein/CheY-like chemotaxis protein
MPGKASTDRSDVSVVFAGPVSDALQRVEDYLIGVGCDVTFASDSDAALAQCLSLQPDVITISERLGPLDGPQLCARLKSDDRTTAIPVILLATSTDIEHLRSADDAGCEVLLIQPVSPDDLFRTMRDAIARAKGLVARADLAAASSRHLRRRTADARAARRATDGTPPPTLATTFDVGKFLDSPARGANVMEYRSGDVIYTQGERGDAVLYVRTGVVKLSVVSNEGREAVVGLLGRGDFFGEGCLTGHAVRTGTATAVAASTILRLEKAEMQRLLHEHRGLSDRFITHILSRNIRVEEDLVDQLFNSTEKRLARALLLLAGYGKQDKPIGSVPKMSQSTLAEMVGTTRSRINFFMKKFERLGFIEYRDGLKVTKGLLTVVLHD